MRLPGMACAGDMINRSFWPNGGERRRASGRRSRAGRDGFYADSMSRTYYVILHAAKAALQLRDIASESHAAVKRLLGFILSKLVSWRPSGEPTSASAWMLG